MESYDDDPLTCPGYRLYEYGYYSGWLITRTAFLAMYSLIGYFIRPQGFYSFITKAPIFLTSASNPPLFALMTALYLYLSEGIVLISISFAWSGDLDRQLNHSYLVLAAALVEYLGFVIDQPPLLTLLPLSLQVRCLADRDRRDLHPEIRRDEVRLDLPLSLR
jgi:hypothetical protein